MTFVSKYFWKYKSLNAHAPITTAFRILSDGKQHQLFLVPTHPPKSTCQVLSRGQSTPHISALVHCTLKTALKLEGYITLLMWPPRPETNWSWIIHITQSALGKFYFPFSSWGLGWSSGQLRFLLFFLYFFFTKLDQCLLEQHLLVCIFIAMS